MSMVFLTEEVIAIRTAFADGKLCAYARTVTAIDKRAGNKHAIIAMQFMNGDLSMESEHIRALLEQNDPITTFNTGSYYFACDEQSKAIDYFKKSKHLF